MRNIRKYSQRLFCKDVYKWCYFSLNICANKQHFHCKHQRISIRQFCRCVALLKCYPKMEMTSRNIISVLNRTRQKNVQFVWIFEMNMMDSGFRDALYGGEIRTVWNVGLFINLASERRGAFIHAFRFHFNVCYILSIDSCHLSFSRAMLDEWCHFVDWIFCCFQSSKQS